MLVTIVTFLSSIDLIITYFVSSCKRNNVLTNPVKIHFNLCGALALTIITYFTINKSDDNAYCATSAVLLHYFFLSSILWMLMEGLSIYRDIIVVLQYKVCGCRKSKFFRTALIIRWGNQNSFDLFYRIFKPTCKFLSRFTHADNITPYHH